MHEYDDVDTTGNPYEPAPAYHGHTAELRTWSNEALYELWEARIGGTDHTPEFMAAVGREITRRDHLTQWKDYGVEHGLTPGGADRFAEFVDAWDGQDLADALTAFRNRP